VRGCGVPSRRGCRSSRLEIRVAETRWRAAKCVRQSRPASAWTWGWGPACCRTSWRFRRNSPNCCNEDSVSRMASRPPDPLQAARHARPSRRSGGPEKGCVHPGRLGPRTPGRQPGRPTAPVAIGTCKCRPPAIHANACLLPPAAFHGPGSLDAAQTPRAGVPASRPPTRNNAVGRRSRRQPDCTCSAGQTGNHAVHLLDVRRIGKPGRSGNHERQDGAVWGREDIEIGRAVANPEAR